MLRRYADTVAASFAGHTHMDDFRLIGDAGGRYAFALITPAVSPIFGQNPAFRTIDYDGPGAVLDQTTYYLDEFAGGDAPPAGRAAGMANGIHLHRAMEPAAGRSAEPRPPLCGDRRSSGRARPLAHLYPGVEPRVLDPVLRRSGQLAQAVRAFHCASGNVPERITDNATAAGHERDGSPRPPSAHDGRLATECATARFRCMRSRLFGIVLVWLLLLATAWVAEPYAVAFWVSATAPRTIAPRADLTAAEQTTIKLFEAASPSVVHVFARAANQRFSLFEPENSVVQSGSGIVWDAAGHVITNHHVVRGTNEVSARFTSGELVGARIVGVAPNYDIAVLQLERPRSELRPIAVGRSADLRVGQAAFAIGNPYGLDQTLTSGIISALNRRLPTSTPYEIAGVIQTDAAVNPGIPADRCSMRPAG